MIRDHQQPPRLQMQLIQLLKSPVTVAVLAVFHDLAIVRRLKEFLFFVPLEVFFWEKTGAMPKGDLKAHYAFTSLC